MWEKALLPVKEVLENTGMKVDEIYAVELIGGATRVPKLQVCSFFLRQTFLISLFFDFMNFSRAVPMICQNRYRVIISIEIQLQEHPKF